MQTGNFFLTRHGSRGWAYGMYAALCLLISCRWILQAGVPNAVSTEWGQSAGCALFAILSFSLSRTDFWRRRACVKPTEAPHTGMAADIVVRVLAGVVVLTTPNLIPLLGGRRLAANEVTLASCLCPAVIAVAGAALEAEQKQLTDRLWPGLAGMAGLLLIVPLPIFSDVRSVLALGVLPLAIGTSATFFGAQALSGSDASEGVTKGSWSLSDSSLLGCVLCVSSLAFALLAACRHAGPLPFPYATAVYDGLTDALSVAVLLHFGAGRWAAHLLLGPCCTVLMGIFLLRPRVDSRTVVGIGLLAAGGWSLFSANSSRAEP